MAFSEIDFPEMRAELIENIQALADPTFQQRAWVDHQFPIGNIMYHDFDSVIHCLYDDSNIEVNPELGIGVILKNKEEADTVKRLMQAIDAAFNRYGLRLKDSEYMRKPEWETIVCKAKDACVQFGIDPVVSTDPDVQREQWNKLVQEAQRKQHE